jgi:hypothetical protein
MAGMRHELKTIEAEIRKAGHGAEHTLPQREGIGMGAEPGSHATSFQSWLAEHSSLVCASDLLLWWPVP